MIAGTVPGDLLREARQGLRVSLRVTPNAARDSIDGVSHRPGIGPQLRIRVRALPDQGRANDAVLALLAKHWDIPRTALLIASGATARDKVLLISGDPDVLRHKLGSWLQGSQ